MSADQQDTTPEELDCQSELNGRFGQALRELVDAGIRTAVAADDILRATVEVEQLAARLRRRQLPGSFGIKVSPQGRPLHWGNAVVGLRNAIAPPLLVERDLGAAAKCTLSFSSVPPARDRRHWCTAVSAH